MGSWLNLNARLKLHLIVRQANGKGGILSGGRIEVALMAVD